jgi:hypothetical protein
VIQNHPKYDLGRQMAHATHGDDTRTTKAAVELRKQVEDAGGWDTDVQLGYDDALREAVQAR